MPPLSLNFSNVQFTHEKVNHVIPKLYVVDKLFDGIEYLLGNNWMSDNKVIVIPYLGVVMGTNTEQVTFMIGLRKTESAAATMYDSYCESHKSCQMLLPPTALQRSLSGKKKQQIKKKVASKPLKGSNCPGLPHRETDCSVEFCRPPRDDDNAGHSCGGTPDAGVGRGDLY